LPPGHVDFVAIGIGNVYLEADGGAGFGGNVERSFDRDLRGVVGIRELRGDGPFQAGGEIVLGGCEKAGVDRGCFGWDCRAAAEPSASAASGGAPATRSRLRSS